MSEKPETGPAIKMLASRMAEVTKKVDFIGRDGKPYERDHEADARWYVAYNLAEEARDCNSARDWGHVFLNGMPPLTDEDVADYLIEGTPTDEEILAWFL
jgi:hypothetical protein